MLPPSLAFQPSKGRILFVNNTIGKDQTTGIVPVFEFLLSSQNQVTALDEETLA
jgi:hypothetical protein